MVCGADQEDILVRLQVADLNHELFGDLDIVLAHRAVARGAKPADSYSSRPAKKE